MRRADLLSAGAFLALAAAVLALIGAADRRQETYRGISARYRMHAIPVALSRLYHHHPRDYTAIHTLAMRFQNPAHDPDTLLREAATADPGVGLYFWVADDRGLADLVEAAFRLFGPRLRSLSQLHLLLVGLSLALLAIGFRQEPIILGWGLGCAFGWLVLLTVFPTASEIRVGDSCWQEPIALCESRLFDALALVAWMHLLLAAIRSWADRLALATALPQAALLLLLYHARSSLGWQYLVLLVVCCGRGLLALARPAERKTGWRQPLLVAVTVLASLGCLTLYQRAMYHAEYFDQRGQRTFWHNAIMGLYFQPELRSRLPVADWTDREAIRAVLQHLQQQETDLDRDQWNEAACLNSLGGHNQFDWPKYERAARDLYFRQWRERPGLMLQCYAWDKPGEIARQTSDLVWILARRLRSGDAPELRAALPLLLLTGGLLVLIGRHRPDWQDAARSLNRLVVIPLPFSLIPAIAFYPALTTLAAFYFLLMSWLGLTVLRLGWRLLRLGGRSGCRNDQKLIPAVAVGAARDPA